MTRLDDIVLNPYADPPPPVRFLIAINEAKVGFIVAWDGGDGVGEEANSVGYQAHDLYFRGKEYNELPPGFWVWKGQFVGHHINTPDCNEYESELVGEFRAATDHELYHYHKYGTLLKEE